MSDLFSKFDALIEQRETLLETGLTDPFNLVMERVESPTVAICNGKRTILLGTYNYMGMTFDPDVIQAGKDALDNFGSGTTGAVAHKMGRRWIMVELGEHCHTHIVPRLRKVIDGGGGRWAGVYHGLPRRGPEHAGGFGLLRCGNRQAALGTSL